MPHVHKLPSGHWRAIAKHNGQRATGTADTRAAAQRLAAKLLLELGAGPRRGAATVADIIGAYISAGEPRWSPTYVADVEAVADRLPERFTDHLAAAVTVSDIDALYSRLSRDGWSPHRLRRLHEVLSAAWEKARQREIVERNPVHLVPKPGERRQELNVPTPGDVVAIIAAVEHQVDRLALRLAATLGARRGEIVALQWRDIDPTTCTVTIRRSLRYTPADGISIGDTKTGEKGHRRVILDPATFALITQWQAAQAAQPRSAGIEPRWVFSDDGGISYWRPDRLTHIFGAARRRAGVAGVRLHDLRHYVATSMLQDGEPSIDVAGRLGHSSPATTERVYAHFLPGRGQAASERLAARLDT